MQAASIIIPLFVIALAAFTKRLIPSLFLGLLAGGVVIARGDPLAGLKASADHVLAALNSEDSVMIILVLFLFGATAEIIKASGGIKGFVQFAGRHVKTERGVYASVWILSIVTFIDCCFHAIATGTVSKPLIEKAGGSRRKLASIINITSCLLIILIPIGTTYAGFITGTISDSLRRAGAEASPYGLFLSSIPYNFFAIVMTAIAIFLTFSKAGFKKELKTPQNEEAREEDEHDHEAHEQCEYEQKAPPRVFNLIIPLALLIVLIFLFAWYTGRDAGGSFISALQNADYERSIFIAAALTITLTSIYYMAQRMPLREIESHFLRGGTEMIPPITILILSWGLSSVVGELGFGEVISRAASAGLPTFLLPALVFIVCCLSSYFMGSAWGTWALIMPVAIPLAANAGVGLPLMVGAVLSGGSLGDNASPLGETAVLSAAITDLPLAEHVKSQLPISLLGVGVSALLFVAVPLIAG